MKYFIDTEFYEGFYKPTFGKKRHFIDLISIGLVASDGREYYAISKDFDLKSAWNKYDLNHGSGDQRNLPPRKIYWLRDNVFKPIWRELEYKDYRSDHNDVKQEFFDLLDGMPESERIDFYLDEMHRATWSKPEFNLKRFSQLIKKYGKSNKQIAEEVFQFCTNDVLSIEKAKYYNVIHNDIEFYGYFADYDWVLFCSLFGRMIDLPKGFPMYCKDLKQMLDEKAEEINQLEMTNHLISGNNWEVISELLKLIHSIDNYTLDMKINLLKTKRDYPKQTNEHNALQDAKWNFELYKFLKL